MPILALLLPIIPSLIQSVVSLVDVIRGHPETPAEIQAHLDAIATDLKSLITKVKAVPLP